MVIITIGYSTTFLAGFGIAYGCHCSSAWKNRVDQTDEFRKDGQRILGAMIYGLPVSLFSLVGTVLGGIWADQSWGRFWG